MSEYPVSIDDVIVCDMTFPQSPCGPLYTPDFAGAMRERLALGVTYTSITIASDEPTIDGAMRWLGEARAHIADHPDLYVLVERVADIERAKAEGKVAINFHFQGTNALLGDLGLVEVYSRLGVKHMLMAYNSRNLVADGCHEDSDVGLSRYGKALVAEMNRVGMIVDVSHTGYRSSLDAMELSSAPVIFSHSNAKALWNHQRNITDEQARACAATGGVIGVNGVGLFLSEARFDNSPEIIARHIDHFANLVGPQHVGFGLDSVHDIPYFLSNFAKAGRDRKYPVGGYLTSNKPAFAGPDVIAKVAQVLARMGWGEAELKGVMGGNWLRVMAQVWG
ncbi:dipeptidase [Solimonas flava]|uniref:dipeptidase n=1 Tax=Solimonas flava TaxID=415849 RepID=UPI0003FC3362|nr:membrane dipeptidase [Solimonas flava]